MPFIRQEITIEQVRAARPEMIYYGASTLWWTHDPRQVCRDPGSGLPCDPRGGMLLQMADVEHWLSQAEANPAHFGKHGLAAFMAAHASNCVVSRLDQRSTCVQTWQEINDLIDRQDVR